MHGFVKAQSRAFVRRTLTVAAAAAALVLAWTHGGLASGPPPPYYIDANGVIRTIGNPPPTGNPEPAPHSHYSNATIANRAPVQVQTNYDMSMKPRVFTINRNGTPWVTVRQVVGGVQIIDPNGGSSYLMDIAGGAKGGVYPTPAPGSSAVPVKSGTGVKIIPITKGTSPP